MPANPLPANPGPLPEGGIVEWGCYALLTWSAPALAFVVWTCANLLPRADARPWNKICTQTANQLLMRSNTTKLINVLLFIALLSFQACAVVGGIFKAGVWVGVIAVVIVVGIVIWIVSKASGKN
jgi:hypothetical protein